MRRPNPHRKKRCLVSACFAGEGNPFNLPVLVINLEARTDRWALMKDQLKSFSIDPVRIPAVAGSGPNKFVANEHVHSARQYR